MHYESLAVDLAQENLINLQLEEIYMECDNPNSLDEIVAQQEDLIIVLEKTLKYYADESRYKTFCDDSVLGDCGQRAKDALLLVEEVMG